MREDRIQNQYFDWLYNLVCGDRFCVDITYKKLFTFLYDTEFIWLIDFDENRAEIGKSLRYRFACEELNDPDDELYLSGPCSVLEMMVALALQCEEEITDDPMLGNRVGQWFWIMLANLGIGSMCDSNFDRKKVERHIRRFLNRDYDKDGKGGLFWIRNCEEDLRDVEIWDQMLWFLDEID